MTTVTTKYLMSRARMPPRHRQDRQAVLAWAKKGNGQKGVPGAKET